MDIKIKGDNRPLYAIVASKMRSLINSGVYKPGDKLPPEDQLASQLGVSRSTLRVALGHLESRGQIIRRHGVGTFVTEVSGIANPLNEAVEFNELITRHGFEPGVQFVSVEITRPPDKVAEMLQISDEQHVLQAHKIFTADGNPVIYCINSIPTWMFSPKLAGEVSTRPQITEPLFDFLEEQCGQWVQYHIASIRAEIAGNVEFPGMALEANTALLGIEEVGYNADWVALWHSYEYFPSGLMTFDLVRYRGPAD